MAASDSIIGVDFGAPRRAADQRRKIVAIEAHRVGDKHYRVSAAGRNVRLLDEPPGWTAKELVEDLVAQPVRVVGFDFPFSVPELLLREPRFAADAGYKDGAFIGWREFNWFVAQRLPLTDPLDFSPFHAWRSRAERTRLWTKRATDEVARGQAPLKDKFQATFQMTLLGNAVLACLWDSNKYRVLPFPGGRGHGEVIEVFPGATLRAIGMHSYKAHPEEAVRSGLAACHAAGLKLELDADVAAACCRYDSGRTSSDHDIADAFVALCTSVLHAEGACRMALDDRIHLKESEGAIWIPSAARSV